MEIKDHSSFHSIHCEETYMNRLKNRLSRILKGYWARMPPAAWRQLLISIVPYAVIGYIAHKLSWLYSYCAGSNLFSRLSVLLNNVPLAFGRPIISFRAQDMITGLTTAITTRIFSALGQESWIRTRQKNFWTSFSIPRFQGKKNMQDA